MTINRIDRISRNTGTQGIPRTQRTLAVPRVGPRPDHDPHEQEHPPTGEQHERRPPQDPDHPHVDVTA